MLANRAKILLRPFIAGYIGVGDEVAFPVPTTNTIGTEILITKNSGSGPNRYLYHAPIAYVSHPKQDKRNQHYVSAEVQTWKPWHSIDFPALRRPARILLSPAEWSRLTRVIPRCMRSCVSRPVLARRASRGFQTS